MSNQYYPDFVFSSGETLLDVLEDRAMSQETLAQLMDVPLQTIRHIINADQEITLDIARSLERVLNVPAEFWLNREWYYQIYLAKSTEWYKQSAFKDLSKNGWIKKFEQVDLQIEETFKFLEVSSMAQWEQKKANLGVAYRKPAKFQSDPDALAIWIHIGELEARNIECAPFDPDRFRVALEQIRRLTVKEAKTVWPTVVELCAQAGVAVVLVTQIRGAKVSGVTHWVSPFKAVIQLSLRYKTDDQLWFTFFHEAAHILLHGKDRVFLEDDQQNDVAEQEANRFASDFLIPPDRWQAFAARQNYTQGVILAFAQELQIARSIVVGRLQYEKIISHNRFNALKGKLVWKEMATG